MEQRLRYLLQQYANDSCSYEEVEELFAGLRKLRKDTVLYSTLQQEWDMLRSEEVVNGVDWDRMFATIINRPGLKTTHRIHFLRTSWFRYAAAVILPLVSAAAIWYIQANRSVKPTGSETATQTTDIQPGSNKAILTIGTNKPIDLSNHKTGISIASNAITYNDGERIADAGQMLMLKTPRGGQYQAVLADGTKVWLNAESSIRFPSKFTGDRREVEVSGEVYMEVAKNLKSPFQVTTGRAIIQVLGTSFNINAYPEEETQRMTLVSGSVKVLLMAAVGRGRIDQGVMLRPGQQAVLSEHNDEIGITAPDLTGVLAWKNGAFNFDGLRLEEVMRQIARWYDLEIVYEKNVPDVQFYGKISRDLSLESLLKALKETDLHYRIENNRRLVVLP